MVGPTVGPEKTSRNLGVKPQIFLLQKRNTCPVDSKRLFCYNIGIQHKKDRAVEDEPKYLGSIKLTLSRDQLAAFLSELHKIQHDMIEAVVASKQNQGFPEASLVLRHIMDRQ